MVDDGENSFVTHVTTQFISCLFVNDVSFNPKQCMVRLVCSLFSESETCSKPRRKEKLQ